MSKYLIETAQWAPSEFHYMVMRNGLDEPQHREGAEEQLKRHGCTRIIHVIPEDQSVGNQAVNGLGSYGIVERGEVVRQRMLMPRYD